MTVVNSPAKVLVTGANGYIAVWIVRILLEQGYAVRGTVRSASKGAYLKKLFEKEGEKFEYVVVEDITKDGAFDEAVKGVQAVLHTASPVVFDVKHPDELIIPALHGTLSVLNSVEKFGTEVKRVVVTSSCAAILEPHEEGYIFSEKDWNEFSIKETAEKQEKALPIHQYRTSKTLAERSAWEFIKDKSLKWDLVTILPPFVFGPLLQETATKESLNFSSDLIYQGVVNPKTGDDLYAYAGNWVDVRDVALSHVLALQKAAAGGERIIVSAGYFAWQDLYDALSALPTPLPDVPKGVPSTTRAPPLVYSSAVAEKLLGVTFRTLGESAHDTIVSARERLFAAPVVTGDGPAMMELKDVEPAD
ncbi:NAD(P)-binding protein [Calocera viscosa TUFC12733]|uniref:NAD(P)-binding protein n=1 Tax=Calocera viscosa (strain TUFC12733) TaxID=1330018 RepID=A0A167JSZ9_CALVF|nr:NAD(P)-binding protein [Calocera viscosa TUFC12733]